MNERNSGRKPKLNAEKGDRKEVIDRSKSFSNAQSRLSGLQKYPPKYLDEVAKYLWRVLVPELEKGGMLKNLDKTEMELFCKNYSIYREACQSIEEHGATYPVYEWYKAGEDSEGKTIYRKQLSRISKNSTVEIVNSTTRNLKSLAADLGLNYSSRADMLVGNKSNQEMDGKKAVEEIKKLFGGGG